MTPTADHACLSCAQKKRKCDRTLPSCSSCKKQNRQCWYRSVGNVPVEFIVPVPEGESEEETGRYQSTGLAVLGESPADASLFSPHGHTQVAFLSLAGDAVKLVAACLRCRSRKKKCDKTMPSCSRCARHRVRCVYPQQNHTATDAGASFLHSLDVRGVDATVPLPVESRPYMPMLLHSFVETFGMDPLPVDDRSLAWLLRATWIQQALSDPCAFHTTLYAASAHLDAFRGTKNSYTTLYHHTIALRLLNQRLTAPGAVFSEPLMACVAPLVFFSSIGGDKDSSQIHKKALMQMIKAKGGLDHLTLGPFLGGLITICVLTEAIINDSHLDIPFLDIPPTPTSPPAYLISGILRRAESKSGYYNLSPATIRIFEDIAFVTQYLANPTTVAIPSLDSPHAHIQTTWRTNLHSTLLSHSHPEAAPAIETEAAAIAESCHAAALIFWYLLDDYTPFSPASLQILVDGLKRALCHGSLETWVRTAPEAHSWVCLLGAAASVTLGDRIFFSLRHGQPVTCVQSLGAFIFLESWRMYDWGNRRREIRVVDEVEFEGVLEEVR